MPSNADKVFINDKMTVGEVTKVLTSVGFPHYKNKNLFKFALIRTGTKAPKQAQPSTLSLALSGSSIERPRRAVPPSPKTPTSQRSDAGQPVTGVQGIYGGQDQPRLRGYGSPGGPGNAPGAGRGMGRGQPPAPSPRSQSVIVVDWDDDETTKSDEGDGEVDPDATTQEVVPQRPQGLPSQDPRQPARPFPLQNSASPDRPERTVPRAPERPQRPDQQSQSHAPPRPDSLQKTPTAPNLPTAQPPRPGQAPAQSPRSQSTQQLVRPTAQPPPRPEGVSSPRRPSSATPTPRRPSRGPSPLTYVSFSAVDFF